MDSFRAIVQPSAEQELRQSPFPFRRQIVQAIYTLKRNPRPSQCENIDSDFYRLPVHGWRVVYGIDDAARTLTIYRISR